MIDIACFAAATNHDLMCSVAEQDIAEGHVRTWLVGGGAWVAGLIIDGLRCFVIGGPDIQDESVFATLASALGAVCAHRKLRLRAEFHAKLLNYLKVTRPDQQDIGRGRYYLQIEDTRDRSSPGVLDDRFLAVNPDGPFGPVHFTSTEAHSLAYDSASNDPD